MTASEDGTSKSDQSPYGRFTRMDSGLIAGAVLLTLDGEKRAQTLKVGDRIITRDAGISTISHIHRVTRPVPLVSVSAEALGVGRPEKDIRLAADQMILIRDWRARTYFNAERALVAARALVDGEMFVDLGPQEVQLTQIFCDAPHILYCDSLELATADGARARGSALHAA